MITFSSLHINTQVLDRKVTSRKPTLEEVGVSWKPKSVAGSEFGNIYIDGEFYSVDLGLNQVVEKTLTKLTNRHKEMHQGYKEKAIKQLKLEWVKKLNHVPFKTFLTDLLINDKTINSRTKVLMSNDNAIAEMEVRDNNSLKILIDGYLNETLSRSYEDTHGEKPWE